MEVPPCRAQPTETSPRVKPITGSTFTGGKKVSALNVSLSPSPREHFHSGESWEERHGGGHLREKIPKRLTPGKGEGWVEGSGSEEF